MKLFPRVMKLAIGLLVFTTTMAIATSITASAASTWGPNRPLKAWSPTASGFNYVTFDSFTGVGNGIGNEPDFYRGLVVGRDSTWTNPVENIVAGDSVEAMIYIHNNADAGLNASGVGVAQNVTVRATIPTGIASTQDSTAYISASNANPGTIYDTLEMTGEDNTAFGLAYESGTAQLHEQDGTVTTLTPTQTAALFSSTGLNLGSQDGCFAHVQVITFEMKASTPAYTLVKQVGLAGQSTSTLTKSITANPGDTLGWLLTFTNTGDTVLNNVDVVDNIPAGLTVAPGSLKLYDGEYPGGYTYPSTAIQENGRQINIGIASYDPGILAYITYRTTIAPATSLACGTNTFVNNAYATPSGLGTIESTAQAIANVSCTTTSPTYTCNTLTITPGDNRTVTVSNFNETAENGAVFDNAVINWGDSTPTTTTSNVEGTTHTYANYGTYTITAIANFTVNGVAQSATSQGCMQTVSYTSPTTPPTVTTVSTPTPPQQLVNTGPGSVLGIFAGVSAASAVAYRWFLGRRLSRG